MPVYSPALTGYSFRLPTHGWLRLSRPGCLLLRRGGFSRQKSVTHRGTNRAWRRVATPIETSFLPLSQTGNQYYSRWHYINASTLWWVNGAVLPWDVTKTRSWSTAPTAKAIKVVPSRLVAHTNGHPSNPSPTITRIHFQTLLTRWACRISGVWRDDNTAFIDSARPHNTPEWSAERQCPRLRIQTIEVGPYRLSRYRYDIDISDPKYRRYRYRYPIESCSKGYRHRYPLLQLSFTNSYNFIIARKVVNDVNVISTSPLQTSRYVTTSHCRIRYSILLIYLSVSKLALKSREKHDKISKNYRYFTYQRHDIDISKKRYLNCRYDTDTDISISRYIDDTSNTDGRFVPMNPLKWKDLRRVLTAHSWNDNAAPTSWQRRMIDCRILCRPNL